VSPALLSLCIPTFNRSGLLAGLLESILLEWPSAEGQMEVVVSDNCSTDDTADVVRHFRTQMPIRYHRHDRNIGVTANICFVPGLATGCYCWILGDDDLLVPGAVTRVLSLLIEHSDVRGVVVGYSYQPDAGRSRYLGSEQVGPFDAPVFGDCHPPKLIARWEDTFFASKVPALHTAIVGCVFSREHWGVHAPDAFEIARLEPQTSLESFAPYTVAWAEFLIGQPVVFAPSPHVYFFVGAQQWFIPRWTTIMFTSCLALAERLRRLGAREEAVRHYESLILRHPSLTSLILRPNDFAKRYFSLARLIRHYGDRKELWDNLLSGAQTGNRRERVKVLLEIARGCVLAPRAALPCGKFLARLGSSRLRRLFAW
jgi:glycosyltransferase involved in cell wall biosynthesis